MNFRIVLRLAIVSMVVLFASCSNYQNFTYLQDTNNIDQSDVTQIAQIKARKGDVLNIYVSSRNPESAIPFNLSAAGYRPGQGSASEQYTNMSRALGYQVDESGNIEFPQLGTLHVEGKSRTEIQDYVKQQLISKGLLKDPIITVEFSNLKISVVGEVTRPGNFTMSNEHTTIFDALGMAGDLTAYGMRDRVAVIREVDGKRTVAWHDLRSKEIFNSPYYYLQQNDIVYVQPNKYKASQSTQSRWNQPSIWISLISTAVSVTTLIRLFTKN